MSIRENMVVMTTSMDDRPAWESIQTRLGKVTVDFSYPF